MAAVLSMFRISFCAVPAFMRVEPAITSGPVCGAMVICASAAGGRIPIRRQQHGRCAALARESQGAQHVGRAAAGRHADDDVPRANLFERRDRCAPCAAESSTPSAARVRARRPPAITACTRREGDAERGRAFGRVKRSEPAARARAHVDQPSALFDGFGNELHGARDRGELSLLRRGARADLRD